MSITCSIPRVPAGLLSELTLHKNKPHIQLVIYKLQTLYIKFPMAIPCLNGHLENQEDIVSKSQANMTSDTAS